MRVIQEPYVMMYEYTYMAMAVCNVYEVLHMDTYIRND
jgi:hypothetical protein